MDGVDTAATTYREEDVADVALTIAFDRTTVRLELTEEDAARLVAELLTALDD